MMTKNEGMLVWVTGLSGSGKTTLARELKTKMETLGHSFIILDGDELREVLSADKSNYSFDERKSLAYIYANLASLITKQKFNVIVSTISMFDEVRDWNRKRNPNYFEIYLKSSDVTRRERDPKKLYSGGENLVSLDTKYEEPKNPDMRFLCEEGSTVENMVDQIQNQLCKLLKGNTQ